MTGWGYYKVIELAGSGAEETDINYKIAVSFEANMQADFADIRFTDSDNETLLEQYRESYTESDSAVFWIKVPSVSAGGKSIRMWYGNAEASLKSDGEATFPLFDDFTGENGDPPDAEKWTDSPGSGYNTIQDNTLQLKSQLGTDNMVLSLVETFGVKYGMVARIKNPSTSKEPFRFIGFDVDPNQQLTIAYCFKGDGSFSRYDFDAVSENVELISLGDWHKLEIRRTSSTTTLFSLDDVTTTLTTDANTDELSAGMTLYTTYQPTVVALLIDWFIVYKIHSTITDTFPEPGEEQTVVEFSADDVTPVVGQVVRFSNESDEGDYTFAWNFGDGNTSVEENPHHQYTRTGTFTVSLTITSGANEYTEEKTDYITVAAAPDDTDVGEMIDDIAFRIQDPHMDGRIDGWNP